MLPSGHSPLPADRSERCLQVQFTWSTLTEISKSEISEPEVSQTKIPQSEITQAKVPQTEIPEAEIPQTEVAKTHVERQRTAHAVAHDVPPAADLPQVDIGPVVEPGKRSVRDRRTSQDRDWDRD